MPSGKTLPSFVPYEIHPRSGGLIVNRFLSGIQPQVNHIIFKGILLPLHGWKRRTNRYCS